jgi:HSP20 family protein
MLTPFDAVDALFQGMQRNLQMPYEDETETQVRPRVDIAESETEFRLRADLPGVTKDNLRVEIENGRLTIAASRKLEDEQNFKNIHVERHGSVRYTRTFHLGEEIDADQIRAEFKDGVLSLTLPKREKALPKRIEVK